VRWCSGVRRSWPALLRGPARDLVALPVADESLRVVCAGQSRLVDPAATDVQSLVGVPWVGFPQGAASSGEPFARAVEQQLLRCGLGDAEHIAIDSLTAQKRLIEADFGIGLMPTSSIEEEVRLGTLHVLTIADLETVIPVTAIHRRGGYLSGAARRLLASLADPACGLAG